MAFDAGFLRAVIKELEDTIIDAKVERIIQPAKDEVQLLLRKYGETYRLLIRAGSNLPRLSLTHKTKETLPTPPMFLMLLRKHLSGARVISVEQLGFERVAKISFAAFDDLGFPCEKCLICEIMGKTSNLMLTGADGKILSVMRPVDFTTSRLRQVLPGMTYELPPKQDKRNPLEETREGFLELWDMETADAPIATMLQAHYLGTATQVFRELAYLASGAYDGTLRDTTFDRLWQVFSSWFHVVKEGPYTPVLMKQADGTTADFSYAPLTYFGGERETFPDFGALLDVCFGEKETTAKIHARAQDVFLTLDRHEKRLQKKLALQEEELREADQGEQYRVMGDLLTANLWKLSKGDTELVTENYYADPVEPIRIELDPRLTPAANAQKFYRTYTKAKHAKAFLEEQMEKARGELAYIATVKDALSRATLESDILEIREELIHAGYGSKQKGAAPGKPLKSKPDVFTSPSGYTVYCGRNNLQNDHLTFHVAEKGDLWFHVKGVPGSHVILVCGGAEPPSEDYTFACQIAAEHSSVTGDQIPVDYTRVRYVKKPPQSKPGYVTYSTNYTAYVRCEKKDHS